MLTDISIKAVFKEAPLYCLAKGAGQASSGNEARPVGIFMRELLCQDMLLTSQTPPRPCACRQAAANKTAEISQTQASVSIVTSKLRQLANILM